MRNSNNFESKLQAECVLWFKNTHVNLKDTLWATFNEGKNVGAKLTMGMSVGCPDLLHYTKHTGLVGVEMKYPGTRHDVSHLIKQAKWLISIPAKGCFCDNKDSFEKIMEDGEMQISPQKVLSYCEDCGKKSIIWDSKIFE